MPSDREVLRAEVKLAKARRSSVATARWRDAEYVPAPFHAQLGTLCDRVADSSLTGTGLRVTCSAPPRHGKTALLGHALPLRCGMLAQRRGLSGFRVLYATASAEAADRVSREVRGAIERIHRETADPWWAPGAVWSRNEFETAGGFRWIGIGYSGATGGIGANLLVMDDLIGNGLSYRSRATREAIRYAVQGDLLSRLMRGGAAVHMETRRGIEDTTGWLLTEYPAIWEEHVWRCYEPERGYLWPEGGYGEAWRATQPHLTDSAPLWRALYQQEPVPEGGTLIPLEWLDATYSEAPDIARRLCSRVVIGCDLTTTGKTTGDAAVFVVLGERGAFRDVLHVRRVKVPYPEQRQILRELAATWRPDGIVVELAAGGDAMVAELQKEIRGIRGERPHGDKVARLTPHLPSIAARQVRLPRMLEPWTGPFREELSGFAGVPGEQDDQVDALVWALVGLTSAPALTTAVLARALRTR